MKKIFKNIHFSYIYKFILFILLIFILISLSIKDHSQTFIEQAFKAPSKHHWFGTDYLGRDLFFRTILGLQLSLFIALSSSFINFLIGIIWGTITAFSPPKIDIFLMKISDIIYSIPYILMVIILMIIFQNSGILSLIIALSLTGWIPIARMVRSEFLVLKNKNYVLFAKTLGGNPCYIVFKHLLPNSIEPILSAVILSIPSIIYNEAFLSFLGLGIQPPKATLGTLVKEGLPSMLYYPWVFLFPILTTGILIFTFNYIGEKISKKIKKC